MPELPEVETVATGVHARVQGRRIVEVVLGRKPEPMKSPSKEMRRALLDHRIARVHRVGKHIVFDLVEAGDAELGKAAGAGRGKTEVKATSTSMPGVPSVPVAQWLVHLGMTGRLLVSQPEVPVPPHTHAILRLDDQREIRFVDARRFGRLSVIWLQAGTAERGRKGTGFAGTSFTGTGQEPLTIGTEAFVALFAPRKSPIKSLLLNQTLLHGVGNIYADESLFRAGILPTRQGVELTRPELLRLRRVLQAVLHKAIASGGSSVSDYVDADGARGFFQLEHCVYLRTGQPCRKCKAPIQRIVLAGRGTHFCLRCQG